MLVFYLISLPLTMGMVILTLKYFAGPDVPTYVFFTVGYTWFCSFSIIILVPADIWTTIVDHSSGGISFFWSLSYWSTFLLTWAVVPTIQGYEDAGDFTMAERLKTSIHGNLVFYLCIGSIGLVGLILFIIFRKNWSGGILGFAMACSNTFGLVTGAFLLGFGLSEIPKGIWKNVDWTVSQKVLSHKVAKMAVKLDDAHQEFSNVIVVAQATSNQISKRDPLRPYMNIIDSMLHQMLKEDPSFKPQGGRFGENDMDYDTDEKSMATLRRRLRIAREEYCRYRSEYMSFVLEALELEDTVKNYERRDATGWKFISSFRPERKGRLGASLDMLEFIWRCVLRKQLEKLLAIILGCMSAALLLAEATILPNGVDLSLFSILINSVGKQEMLVQVAAFIPLMYMCVCTYYSLFKIGMLMFYSFTPKQTSSVSLLMICSMVARYAPPISYNFLNLIHLPGNRKTIFEKRMGNIDDAVPFFGKGFNKIYPLIMVIYTLLLVTNFFDRVIDYFGNWKLFKFQDEVDDTDGFDPSGLIILQKERSWLERGHKVGEHVIPLARNFNGMSIEIEPGSNKTDKAVTDTSVQSAIEIGKGDQLKPLKEEAQHDTSKEAISKKYFGIRAHQNIQASNKNSTQKDLTSLTVDAGNSESAMTPPIPSGGLASKWESMKSGLLNFKSNLEAKKFLPLRQTRENTMSSGASSSESLDEIFQRLKRPTLDLRDYGAENDLFEHD
ncbi:PREDICTED: LMBR1 domain-containing protein 2 homolog A isoform X1 [Theobroma cacao]|uniref:LMBR1 domain-containing protein 2 homolog A isoform X1 n=2 Tax=Theobroma cacao TaxID=3641 RepID=A0AB32VXZ5_THECC|nr:PREDICTED: LMBR1 domain-containing protein 2 homolog A isoform X1 [Theobroma cacao]